VSSDEDEAAPEAPADTIRRAAKVMRGHAEAATKGPWRAVAGRWGDETFAAVVAPEGDPANAETWLMATGRGSICQEADAKHAAFWHPGVAVAVADWLDRFGDLVYCYGPAEFDAALAVARAYLGEVAP
jgi:hypothetical protein